MNNTDKIKENIRAAYNTISHSFCHTRNYLWREMAGIKEYVKEGKVLDLGCGNGRLYELFAENPNIEYVGVDFSDELIKFAKSRYVTRDFESKRKDVPEQKGPMPKFEVADITEYKIAPKAYDLITLIASYHHIPSKKERLELLKRIRDGLTDDGVVVLTIWNLWNKKSIKKVLGSWWRKVLRKEDGGLLDIYYPYFDNGQVSYRYYRMFTIWAIRRELRRYFKIYKEEKWQRGRNLAFFLKSP